MSHIVLATTPCLALTREVTLMTGSASDRASNDWPAMQVMKHVTLSALSRTYAIDCTEDLIVQMNATADE